MSLNESKTKTLLVYRSRTMHPPSPPLPIGRTDDLDIFRVTFDYKIIFEKQDTRKVSQWLGILRKSWHVFHNRLLLWRFFRGFALAVLEHCSAMWCSAADTRLKLLDRVVSCNRFFNLGCVWVWQCASSICFCIMNALQDQV